MFSWSDSRSSSDCHVRLSFVGLDHHWILGLSECQKRIVSSRRNRSWCHPLFSCCSWRRQSLWLRSCLRVKKITNKSILFIKGVRQIILALGGVFFFGKNDSLNCDIAPYWWYVGLSRSDFTFKIFKVKVKVSTQKTTRRWKWLVKIEH